MLGLAAVLVAIPAVTVIRSSPLSERPSAIFSSVRPLAALKEMGASLRPLVHTLHYIGNGVLSVGQDLLARTDLRQSRTCLGNGKGVHMYRSKNCPPVIGSPSKPRLWTYERYGGLGFSDCGGALYELRDPRRSMSYFLLPCSFDLGGSL